MLLNKQDNLPLNSITHCIIIIHLDHSGLLKKDAEFTAENDHVNKKVSLWVGDITWLEIDAIVNAGTLI